MGIEPILGTEWDQNPFDFTHDSDHSSHTNDLDKLPVLDAYIRNMFLVTIRKKFYMKQRCNTFPLTVEHSTNHVAMQATRLGPAQDVHFACILWYVEKNIYLI